MREKLYRFMMGRYGADTLNKVLAYSAVVIVIFNLFTRNMYVTLVSYVLWILCFFRMFSRNIYKRRKENQTFLKLVHPVTSRVSFLKRKLTDRANRYYHCPNCKQVVRVPKGRGTITITCPKCKSKFDKRS